MNVERNLICGNVLAENRTDNLVELQELQKVAKPGVLKSYLEDMVPYLVSFAVRVLIALVIYFIGKG